MAAAGRKAIVVGVLIVFVVLAARAADRSQGSAPDFAINWTAARSIDEGAPLYDRDVQRQLAVDHGVRFDFPAYDSLFRSFIGLPTTAVPYLPLVGLEIDQAVDVWRVGEVLAFGGAIALLVFSLPQRSRRLAAGAGVLAVVAFAPFTDSVALGQVDGLIVFAFAFATWCSVRERWWLCGVALGIPVLLKVSPVLILGYLLLRGRWRPVVAAAATVAGGLVISAVIAPGALGDWWHGVRPGLAGGTLHVQNMAAPAWVARAVASTDNLLDYGSAIPAVWRVLAIATGLAVLVWLSLARRGARFDPLEIGAVVVVALLVGPITWENYLTWLLVPVVLLADRDRWAHLTKRAAVTCGSALAVAAVILVRPVQLYGSTVRVWSSGRPVALGLVLVVVLFVLRTSTTSGVAVGFDRLRRVERPSRRSSSP